MPSEVSRKGTASPIEYTASRKIPLVTESWAAAKVRITPRIGPTQGVHPKAKAKPIRKAPHGELPPLMLCSRASVYNALILNRPVKCSPNRIMTTPAICASSDLYRASSCPTSVEIAPSVTNTTLKPRIKPMEFSITLENRRDSGAFNSSTPAPEINDTYPGTRGKTQG